MPRIDWPFNITVVMSPGSGERGAGRGQADDPEHPPFGKRCHRRGLHGSDAGGVERIVDACGKIAADRCVEVCFRAGIDDMGRTIIERERAAVGMGFDKDNRRAALQPAAHHCAQSDRSAPRHEQ